MNKPFPIMIFFLLLFLAPAIALSEGGSIKGKVTDRDTRSPLVGANIQIVGSRRGAATDTSGGFTLAGLSPGTYILQVSCIGYSSSRVTDIVVRPARMTPVEVLLTSQTLEEDEVSVTAGYFRDLEARPASTISFSYEEVRRAPGAVGDISRSMSALPSVAKTNDQYNSLLVRGGTPLENAFYVDNIEIPNINHFPAQGSTGGAIGALNLDLVQDVTFSSGGFGVQYGDRLSAIMDVSLRAGNRDRVDAQVELGMAGAGAEAEGPWAGGNGSWMVSARHSYTDLLSRIAGFGTSPSYSDAQTKAVYDLGPEHRITALDMFSFDRNRISEERGIEHDINIFGSDDALANTAGLTWRWLWGKNGCSTTSLSHTLQKFDTDYREAVTHGQLMRNHSNDQTFRLRSTNYARVSPGFAITFGVDLQVLRSDFDMLFGELTDALGNPTPEATVRETARMTRAGLFASGTARLLEPLEVTVGLRADRSPAQRTIAVSPRAMFTVKAAGGTSVYGSVGQYRQTLPLLLYSLNAANTHLADPSAIHVVVGSSRLLGEDMRVTVEAYLKEYRNMPMDPAQPSIFILDEFASRYGFFVNHAPLVSQGRARSRGIEMILQKKLAVDFYGIVSAAFSENRYLGLDGLWRNRLSDNRLSFCVEGGYKPSPAWEFSLRWLYAGGVPSTPFDMEESRRVHRGVCDDSQVNAARLPDYHCLNVRADRRFAFERTNLVLYLDVWNVYNRKNVSAYLWSAKTNEPGVEYQWSILPILGVEYEF